MDIIAHGLWAGLGVRWLTRDKPVSTKLAAASIGLSMLPDVVHMLPLGLWAAFGDGSLDQLMAYATAIPGAEPDMPHWLHQWSHHLHCLLHSAVIAAAATLASWRWRSKLWLPLAGWWLHIVIDVFTHSNDFYPVPVLYPITYQGFDGVAWNTPWFMLLNYTALLLGWWLVGRRKAGSRPL